MSEPTSPDDRSLGPPERLHPLFLLSGLGGSLRGLVGGYAALAYLAISGRLSTAIFGAIALLLIMAFGIFFYWSRFEYRVGANEIRIDSGILSRRHRSIPFERIQDVDITQGLLARLLGLAQVKFDTGGSAAPGAEEGVLPAITLERAQQIRLLLRARRSREAVAAPEAAGEERQPVFAMSFPRLLLAGTFNFSLAVFAGLFGLTQTFGDALGFDPLRESFWRNLFAASEPLQEFVLAHRLVAVVAGIALLVLIGMATGIVRTVLRDYGFRLDRTEAGLRRRRGLFTRTDVTLPVRRAQAVIFRSGPVRAAFGWRELMLQSLAQEEGGRGAHALAPLASRHEAGAIVSELGWRPVPDDVTWARVSRAYVWMRVIALAPLFLVAALQMAALLVSAESDRTNPAIGWTAAIAIPALLVLAALAGVLLLRWIDWRRTGYALDGDRLLIRSGWWRRRLVILPFTKLQSVDLTENFVSRWFGTASLRFGVAGGAIRGEIIPAIPRTTARQLRDELLRSAT